MILRVSCRYEAGVSGRNKPAYSNKNISVNMTNSCIIIDVCNTHVHNDNNARIILLLLMYLTRMTY